MVFKGGASDPLNLLGVLLTVLAARLVARMLGWVARRCAGIGGVERPTARLRAHIAKLRREAEELNSPSTFAKHAKIKRRIIKHEKDLAAMGTCGRGRAGGGAGRGDDEPRALTRRHAHTHTHTLTVEAEEQEKARAASPSYFVFLARYVDLLPVVAAYAFALNFWWSTPMFHLRMFLPEAVHPAREFGVLVWLPLCHAGFARLGL